MSKQTATQYLIEEIKKDSLVQAKSTEEWNEVFRIAKEMEREQIEQAYTCGDVDSFGRIHHPEHYKYKSAYKYYNERYGGNNE